MSNYTIAVDWSGKNALSDSDAAKIISGTDFNTEFTTVQTAINSKSNLNGNSSEDFAINNGTVAGTLAITGVPTGPTQSAGNNTTRLATTAFVTTAVAALDAAAINAIVYPVGSIYFNATVATNPATLLGFGTWAIYGAGKVMVGLDAGDTDFDAVTDTGGSKTHTLTIAEMPAHTHTNWAYQSTFNPIRTHESKAYADTNNPANSPPLADTGGGGAHNNLQPYVVIHMWKRTA
jgi:hypothetical protein